MKQFIKGIDWKRILIILLVSLLIGLVFEMGFQWKVLTLSSDEKSVTTIGDESISEKKGRIKIVLGDQYVNKFAFDYEISGDMKCTVALVTYDPYHQEQKESYEDVLLKELTSSCSSIRKSVKQITITPEESETELNISSFRIDNRVQLNGTRLFFFFTLALIILSVIIYRKKIVSKPECAFLGIGIAVGLLFIICLPPHLTSWDEHIHFGNANAFASIGKQMTNAEYLVLSHPEDFVKYTTTAEEKKELIQYLNGGQGQTLTGAINHWSQINYYTVIGYMFQFIAVKAAKLIGLPFYFVFLAGKVMGLAVYLSCMFFAIKIVPGGKRLLGILALLPTSMFLAVSYTYDTTVISFTVLGICFILREILEKERKINIKKTILYLGFMFVGIIPKAVYAPLVLIGIMIPKKKFEDKRTCILYRIGLVGMFLVLMSTFVLPSIIGHNVQADARGGETDVYGQMTMVFSHLGGYIQILFENIRDRFGEFLVGTQGIGNLAYLGFASYKYLTTALIIFVAATDTIGWNEQNQLKVQQRIWIMLTIFAAIALIWTALYLAFTPVGAQTINGVSGRYYLPIVPIFFLALQNKNIKNELKPELYHVGIYLVSIFIIFEVVWSNVLKVFCF